jgi:hypothetical protein
LPGRKSTKNCPTPGPIRIQKSNCGPPTEALMRQLGFPIGQISMRARWSGIYAVRHPAFVPITTVVTVVNPMGSRRELEPIQTRTVSPGPAIWTGRSAVIAVLHVIAGEAWIYRTAGRAALRDRVRRAR